MTYVIGPSDAAPAPPSAVVAEASSIDPNLHLPDGDSIFSFLATLGPILLDSDFNQQDTALRFQSHTSSALDYQYQEDLSRVDY